MADRFDAMADDLAQMVDPKDDICEAGWACHFHPVYGFVPEADCPVHDNRHTITLQRRNDSEGQPSQGE